MNGRGRAEDATRNQGTGVQQSEGNDWQSISQRRAPRDKRRFSGRYPSRAKILCYALGGRTLSGSLSHQTENP